MTKPLPARRDEWGELGPAMRNLPNAKWQAFATFYVLDTYTNSHKNNYGPQASAARKAGFGGPKTKPKTLAHIGWKLMRDDRMMAAVAEESRKLLRAGQPEAVKAVHNGMRNPDHKDHARFVAMVLDRADPVESRQFVEVVHRTVDPDQEALEELRALRQLGTSHEKLIELFGSNGLDRIERLESADNDRRAREAKVIDGEIISEAAIEEAAEVTIEVAAGEKDDF
jgi:hypothetical protein